MILWTHRKTGNLYRILGVVTNSTNEQDGQSMVRYQRCIPHDRVGFVGIGAEFVRERDEFFQKFRYEGIAA